MRALSLAWVATVVGTFLFFLDAPALTFGQKFRRVKLAERLLLISFELNLVLLFVLVKFYRGWDRPLVPEPLAIPAAVVGLAISLAGAGLTVWGKRRLGRWFSGTFAIKEGHELVTDGPYAIVRHPIYLGMITILSGGALVVNSLLVLGLALGAAMLLFFHTALEEAMFEAHFGESYREYQRRVPRLLLWPRPKA